MASSDPYATTDKLDDSLLQVIVTRLEARGKHPQFEKMLHDYLDAMQIDRRRRCSTWDAAPASPRARSLAAAAFRDVCSASI